MSRTLIAQPAAALCTGMVDGIIQGGDRFPSENTLIGEFGISRTVARLALTGLQTDGLVETERGRDSTALTPVPTLLATSATRGCVTAGTTGRGDNDYVDPTARRGHWLA